MVSTQAHEYQKPITIGTILEAVAICITPREEAGSRGGMELGTKEKTPPPSLGSGIGGVKMYSHAPLNCGCHNTVHHVK